ncbi:unnamed protein product [Lactuca saligna]|uniref:RING-type domain-containing protein n=1 Tax=Lactuca saligna TaxID=75948 RepID=A0AA35ZQD5_LACSI|nr:unnamed protein product [Lactuca saligna]
MIITSLPSIKLTIVSSSLLKTPLIHYGDKMKELFTSMFSLIFFHALLLIFVFHFGVAGGIIGAVVGALIGFKDKTNLLQDVIMGATSGASLSQKITTATFQQLLYSDHDDEHDCFLHLVDIVASALESKLLRDEDHIFLINKVASCEKLIKLPKIEITKDDVFDAFGNATCCSICLQDFEVADAAGMFPQCEHKFHPECISQWLLNHNTCPVCRRSI